MHVHMHLVLRCLRAFMEFITFSDFYVSFASAESTLENYVKDSIPLDKNHNKACEQLVDVEKSLSNVANSSNKVSQILCMDEKLPIKFLS